MTKEEFKAEVSELSFAYEWYRCTWEQFLEKVWQLHVQSQWISVEDELPPKPSEYEELSIVVLATDGEEVYKGLYMSGEDLNGWFTPDMWVLNDITHWMPLPQPPMEIRGNQRKISPNQQQIIGTPEHIKTALDVMDKKGDEK